MKDRNCEVIRRELEELTLNEEFSATAAGHLQTCAECREFQRQQMKLRQIVGSLGTVNAPADFDFRLRARLAADAEKPSFRFWSVTIKGLATAAVLTVFGVGAVVVWQRTQEPAATVAVAPAPAQTVQPPSEEPNRDLSSAAHGPEPVPAVAINTPSPRKTERRIPQNPKRSVVSADFSSERANVVSSTQPAFDPAPVFPIEASLHSVKVSLDDGRGNARTISFPTVSFGSQRVLTTANQFAPKGVW